jgi:hypothetical protein
MAPVLRLQLAKRRSVLDRLRLIVVDFETLSHRLRQAAIGSGARD